MALIKCPECHHEVSSTAIACPNCGYILKNSSNKSTNLGMDINGKVGQRLSERYGYAMLEVIGYLCLGIYIFIRSFFFDEVSTLIMMCLFGFALIVVSTILLVTFATKFNPEKVGINKALENEGQFIAKCMIFFGILAILFAITMYVVTLILGIEKEGTELIVCSIALLILGISSIVYGVYRKAHRY